MDKMEEVIDYDVESNMQFDDVHKVKEKIRKQRSSIGRYLASPIKGLSSCITDAIDQIPLDTKTASNYDNEGHHNISAKSDKCSSIESMENINRLDKIEFYGKREKILKKEIDDWKEMCRERKNDYLEAKVRYKEAVNEQSRIDDSQMKLLTKKQRDFLLQKPDYNSFVQVVRDSESDFICTMHEVKHATNLIEHSLDRLRISNDAKYALYEKELKDKPERTPKEIIKLLMDADNAIQEVQQK